MPMETAHFAWHFKRENNTSNAKKPLLIFVQLRYFWLSWQECTRYITARKDLKTLPLACTVAPLHCLKHLEKWALFKRTNTFLTRSKLLPMRLRVKSLPKQK